MPKRITLEEFLKKVQPACDHSVWIAKQATGWSEETCKKLLNKAVEQGLYSKEWIKGGGNNKGVHRSVKFIGRFHYTRLK